MGFKADITQYQEMLREYDKRGERMRRQRVPSNYGTSSDTVQTDEVDWYYERFEDILGREYDYVCERFGCDGMSCGH